MQSAAQEWQDDFVVPLANPLNLFTCLSYSSAFTLGVMKTRIASLSIEINAASGATIQLLPAGEFRARDGRPDECDHWLMDAGIASALIAAAATRETPFVIDYEHQTLRAATNGLPAPAAGWFKSLEWRDGEGLFAVDVQWTSTAAASIADLAYRYISPVFTYDKSGRVVALLHAALTNTPALDGMDEVMLAAASLLATASTTEGITTMNPELLEQLRWMLNLPLSATADDIKAELQKLIDKISNGQGPAAASVGLVSILENHDSQVAALTAQLDTPDPARFVAVEVMNQAITQAREAGQQAGAAALATTQTETLIEAALNDGRLLPAQKEWALGLGKANPDSLRTYLEKQPPIAALTVTQTGGRPPAGSQTRHPASQNIDDELDLAVLNMMDIDPQTLKQE